MKPSIELIFTIIFFAILMCSAVIFITGDSDTYFHYSVAKYLIKDPDFILRSEQTGHSLVFTSGLPIFNYPPLFHIFIAFLLLLSLPLYILTLVSLVVIGYFLYKIEPRAVPFLFLSFLFIRVTIYGMNDILLLVFAMAVIYYFEKSPIKSGVFAGLAPLVKTSGLFILIAYILSIIFLKRKEIMKKNFYKNKFFIGIIIALLILSPWHIRNAVLYEGDPIATITSQDPQIIFFQESRFKVEHVGQPEELLWDPTGWYPLPIDLLLYIGLAFTIYNFYKRRKIKVEEIFILFFAGMYFLAHLLDIRLIMQLRYYVPIFPLLAIQIARGIPKQYIRFAYIPCIVMFVFFMFYIPVSSYNFYDAGMDEMCQALRDKMGYEPVFNMAYSKWYITYKCDLNYTQLFNETKYSIIDKRIDNELGIEITTWNHTT